MYRWFRQLVVVGYALVVTVAGGMLWFVQQHYSDPETVRELILGQLQRALPGATIELAGAEATWTGGVCLHGLVVHSSERPGEPLSQFLALKSLTIVPDREELMRGRLVVTRATAIEPKLYLRRLEDGTWNIARWLGKVPPVFLASAQVEVFRGSLSIEDLEDDENVLGGNGILEIADMKIELMLLPVSRIAWRATGVSSLQTQVFFQGHADLADKTFVIESARTESITLEKILALLPERVKEPIRSCRTLDGKVSLALSGTFQPGNAAQPWTGALLVQLTDVICDHPKLPYPMQRWTGVVRIDPEGISTDRMQLVCGPAWGHVRFEVPQFDPERLAISLALRELPLSPELYAVLDEEMQTAWNHFSPEGKLDLMLDMVRKNGSPVVTGQVRFLGNAITHWRFPYRLAEITGGARLTEDRDLHFEGIGFAGDRPVRFSGSVLGMTPNCPLTLSVEGSGIPYDERAIAALPEGVQLGLSHFQGTGVADFRARIYREVGRKNVEFGVEMDLRAESFVCDWFPYPLESITGRLTITPSETVIEQCEGRSGGATVRMGGRLVATTEGPHLEMELETRDLPLDERLRAALPPSLHHSFDEMRPSGRIGGWVRLVKPPDEPLDIELHVDPAQAAILPVCFPYRLHGFEGILHYQNQSIWWDQMRCRHGVTRWECSGGEMTPLADGGGVLILRGLRSAEFELGGDFRRAVTGDVQEVIDFIAPSQPIALDMRTMRIEWHPNSNKPDLTFDGTLAFRESDMVPSVGVKRATGTLSVEGYAGGQGQFIDGNLAIRSMSASGFEPTNLSCRVQVRNENVLLGNVQADFYGGKLYGWLKAVTGPEPAYECRIDVFDASLADYARTFPDSPPIGGQLDANVFLSGRGSSIGTLSGRGSLGVRNADIVRTPPMLDLADVLGQKLPDGQIFDNVKLEFRLDDRLLLVDHFDLTSPTLCLLMTERKAGRIHLDTWDTSLRLGVRWARGRLRIPIFTETVNLASDQLLTVHIHGRLDDPTITPEPARGLQRILQAPLRRAD